MKKFIKKIFFINGIFLLISLFVYLHFFLIRPDDTLLYAMKLASTKFSFVIKKIRIGDSVGRQYYDIGVQPDSGIINLTTNAASSMLANYLLLRKLTVVNKENLSDSLQIEGYFRPSSIAYNLDGSTATNYFIKNFYSDQWLFNSELMDKGTAAIVDSIFLGRYPKRKIIKRLHKVEFMQSLISIPGVLNPNTPVAKNKNSLAGNLSGLMKQHFPQYKSIYCPVSVSKAPDEIKAVSMINGIWKPVDSLPIFNDFYFLKDKIHFKNKRIYP
jgi:hypothetical protein